MIQRLAGLESPMTGSTNHIYRKCLEYQIWNLPHDHVIFAHTAFVFIPWTTSASNPLPAATRPTKMKIFEDLQDDRRFETTVRGNRAVSGSALRHNARKLENNLRRIMTIASVGPCAGQDLLRPEKCQSWVGTRTIFLAFHAKLP